jgi:hypothetical protein
MQWQDRFRRARGEWMLLTFYERFEQVVILILTGLIAIVIVFAVWNLGLKIFHAVLSPQNFDPTDYSVFQAIFGAIFTVIIALVRGSLFGCVPEIEVRPCRLSVGCRSSTPTKTAEGIPQRSLASTPFWAVCGFAGGADLTSLTIKRWLRRSNLRSRRWQERSIPQKYDGPSLPAALCGMSGADVTKDS